MPSNPSDEEQLLLELINRFRADPDGEFARLTGAEAPPGVLSAMSYFGVTQSALEAQLAALGSVAPLAWNGNLADAADGHNQAMIDADAQTHQAPGEPNLGQRATDAGYIWSALGENVYAFSTDAAYGHAGFVIDWGYDDEDFNGAQLYPDWQTRGDGMQDPPGHRNSLISASFTEIGISVVTETDTGTDVGPQLITQDLGNRFNYQAQFVGVVINDADGDDFYDIGEGLGGVSVLLQRQGGGSYNTTTWSSGGWQAVVPAGTYTITFSGGGLTAPIIETAVIGSVNVKVDAIATAGGGSNIPTEGPDTLTGTSGADTINGLGGNDSISGLGGIDTLSGGSGQDEISGGAGNDRLYGNAGNDSLFGNAGNDTTVGNFGADDMDGGEGIDLLDYSASAVGVSVSLFAGTGSGGDAQGDSFTGFENILGTALTDVLTGDGNANALTGGDGSDTLNGGGGQDSINGGGGIDLLYGNAGNDALVGGSGADKLFGGFGRDTMTGNAGNDQFRFYDGETAATRNGADVVTDFSQAQDDLLRLKEMDANTTLAGDQKFMFIGAGAFTGVARQLHYVHDGGNTYIEGDTDGDGTADFVIRLDGLHTLTIPDFVL